MKMYYCPYCGQLQLPPSLTGEIPCVACGTMIFAAESIHDEEYYTLKANNGFTEDEYYDIEENHPELLTETRTEGEILFDEEISKNPLLDLEKHEKKLAYDKDRFDAFLESMRPHQQVYYPKCPTCGSMNVDKITALNRAAHAYAFGLFSKTARSQFECKNCGYKW